MKSKMRAFWKSASGSACIDACISGRIACWPDHRLAIATAYLVPGISRTWLIVTRRGPPWLTVTPLRICTGSQAGSIIVPFAPPPRHPTAQTACLRSTWARVSPVCLLWTARPFHACLANCRCVPCSLVPLFICSLFTCSFVPCSLFLVPCCSLCVVPCSPCLLSSFLLHLLLQPSNLGLVVLINTVLFIILSSPFPVFAWWFNISTISLQNKIYSFDFLFCLVVCLFESF